MLQKNWFILTYGYDKKLTLCMPSSADFLKIKFFEKLFQEYHQCQTD